MSWETFWAPNLVQWIVGGALTAAAGLVARFLLKRWFESSLRPWIEEWLKSVVGASNEAAKESREAKKTVLGLISTDGQVTAIPDQDSALEYLKETNSRLVAQLVIQASKHPEDFDSPTAPRPAVPTDEDATYITGRHALRPAEQEQP